MTKFRVKSAIMSGVNRKTAIWTTSVETVKTEAKTLGN
jgi:hypothetical protein